MRGVLWLVGFALTLALVVGLALGPLNSIADKGQAPPADPSPLPSATPSPSPTPTARALSPLQGMSLEWRRNDGPAGGCASLSLKGMSEVRYGPCGREPQVGVLTEEELREYLVFATRYAGWSGVAGVTFSGRGSREATPQEQEAVARWAEAVYERLVAEAQWADLSLRAREHLAARLGVSPEAIDTLAVEPVVWADACLELPSPGLYCARVSTPGYRILLGADGWVYTYHSDGRAQLRDAGEPRPREDTAAAPTPTPTAVLSATPPTDAWRGEYYDGRDLRGAPVLVRADPAIDFRWGQGSPAPEVPADGFSVRWTRWVDLAPGIYRFEVEADDGVRLWVAGRQVVDAWRDGHIREVEDRRLNGGLYEVVVEYYERGGDAYIRCDWQFVRSAPTATPQPSPTPVPRSLVTGWRAEYWKGEEPKGKPKAEERVEHLDFDWGEGSPHKKIGDSRFSARFTAEEKLPKGEYLLRLLVDDGAKVWVDDELVINAWTRGGRREYTKRLRLGGNHSFRVDYYDAGGEASITFRVERQED